MAEEERSPPAAAASHGEARVLVEKARSVAGRALPPPPPGLAPDAVTIGLMYQYVEPPWTPKQHRKALAKVIALAEEHGVTGRGRCAPEGLNCTLTASAEGLRGFCLALRAWDPLFNETDFKLTDGLEAKQRFKAFSLRKTEELVNYGLEGEKAPSLERHVGTHLEAHEYHEAMKKPDTVIIDVRNYYESQIGHFQPPPGGAELVDPKMRNSSDFPKWLSAPETKAKLEGKDVLMYCTGGIRCERATALLNQFSEVDGLQTKSVSMVRGGIERYLHTFPEGGFWKGKNYLFDKRMEQVADGKAPDDADQEAREFARCCACAAPWASYRGQFKCGDPSCRVPVIVCPKCAASKGAAAANPDALRCPLCQEGFRGNKRAAPDLVGQKRKLGEAAGAQHSRAEETRRVFVGKLPLVVTASAVKAELGADLVAWIPDRKTGGFYGAAFARLPDASAAAALVSRAGEKDGVRLNGKRLKINLSPLKEGEAWPEPGFVEREFPPIGA